MTTYLQLFLAFLQIGAFSFGGGYAAIPLIQSQVIDRYGWLTAKDFTDLITISQMTPGPIAINAATFIGSRVGGIPGSMLATAGVILPSCIFVSVLAMVYRRYRKLALLQNVLSTLRPSVVALIFSAGLVLMKPVLFADGTLSFAGGNFQIRLFLLFAAAVVALRRFKLDPILVMVMTGLAELFFRAVRIQ